MHVVDRRLAWVGLIGCGLVALASVGDAIVPSSRLDMAEAVEATRLEIHRGDYQAAERRAQQLYRSMESAGLAHSRVAAPAIDVVVEAAIRNGKAAADSTVSLAERAVALRNAGSGQAGLELAQALHNLADVRTAHGEFDVALALEERALSLRLASRPPDHDLVASSLDRIGATLIRLERFAEADAQLARSLRTRERHADSAPLALARTLELIGLLRRSDSDYARAEEPLARAAAIRARWSPAHPDDISLLQVRGDLLYLKGDVKSAQSLWSEALALATRTLGTQHPVLPEILRRLGLAAYAEGNLGEARRLRERALRVAVATLAPCDPALVSQMDEVAHSLQSSGEYAAARRQLQQSLASTEQCSKVRRAGGASDILATTLYNMADLAREMGEFDEAQGLYERAVNVWSEGLGPEHSFVAHGLDALADVAATQGQLARARELYERALRIRRTALSESHPLTAWTLVNLSRVLGASGLEDEALRNIDRALAIYATTGSGDEPDHLARALAMRGQLMAQRGRFAAARQNLAQALAERERVFGASHPLAAEARVVMAGIDLARGAPRIAFEEALFAEDSGRRNLRNTVRFLPERQAMQYAARRPRGLDLALSVAAAGTGIDTVLLFDAVIRSRGIILDELAERGHTTVGVDALSQTLGQDAQSTRQRFANLVVRSLEEPVPRRILDEARLRSEDAERTFAEHSAKAREDLAKASAGFDDVVRALRSDAGLVSFVRYERTVPGTPRAGTTLAAAAYAALVIRSGGTGPLFVPLGTAREIDAAVTAWRTAVLASATAGARGTSLASAGASLRQLVWDPVVPALAGASLVFVVPDGQLNLVDFDALPDRRGGYLAEGTVVFHYLATERDLVTPAAEAGGTASLLAVGGPAFDDTPGAPGETRGGCDSLGQVHFSDLPGARNEVQEISRDWPGGAQAVTTLSGLGASEKAVKDAMPGHRVVHLATHAFFLGGNCDPQVDGTRALGAVVAAGAPFATSLAAESPLMLSGLALSGANHRGRAALDHDDGILTGEEIASLNLRGTEWAVLSACDTGLGEIKTGEGVFGLRRAFQIAGVRTVITSLWSVSDQATQEWMRALYDARFRQRLGTAQAIRAANLTVLGARRARGQGVSPFYWAAFVAAGDWR